MHRVSCGWGKENVELSVVMYHPVHAVASCLLTWRAKAKQKRSAGALLFSQNDSSFLPAGLIPLYGSTLSTCGLYRPAWGGCEHRQSHSLLGSSPASTGVAGCGSFRLSRSTKLSRGGALGSLAA